MAKKSLPTVADLRQLLQYDRESGRLLWLPRSDAPQSWNTRYAWREALGSVGASGYRQGYLKYTKVAAHKVIWALMHGEWPDGFIDHVDRNKTNNRIENLRLCSRSENARNRLSERGARSRFVGVSPSGGKWRATIVLSKKQHHLGMFNDEASAARAYDRAALDMHGSFACLNFPEGRQ